MAWDDDELVRARRRFEQDLAADLAEVEAAESEFDAAGRSLLEEFRDWTARGSGVLLGLADGSELTGLVVGEGADHVVVDDDGDRGEVVVPLRSIEVASARPGSIPRRPLVSTVTVRGVLRSAVAMSQPVVVWRRGTSITVQPTAVADAHLLGRADGRDVVLALRALCAFAVVEG